MDIRDVFPPEVRERAAERIFDRPIDGEGPGTAGYVCAEGYCIVGALLCASGWPTIQRPGPSGALLALQGRYPDYGDPRFTLLADLMRGNDAGEFADRAAVRRALLPEEEV